MAWANRGARSAAVDLGIRTLGVRRGRAGTQRTASTSLGEHVRGGAAEIERDGAHGVRVVERYLAGPSGLEQTFHMGRRLPGSGSLRVDVAFTGLAPVADATHHRLRLFDAQGRERAVYRDLAACDANGRDLPAHMELHGRVATLVIDDRKAAYPVEVDPLIAVEQAKLHASDGAAMDFFGTGAALSGDGDTAVVGAPERQVGANTLQGSAYVFVRSGSTCCRVAQSRDGHGTEGTLLSTLALAFALVRRRRKRRRGSAKRNARSALLPT